MIIIRIIGGLGNQMFQYAFGRALSIHNNVECKYDITGYEDFYHLHQYGLNNFNITGEIASREEIKGIKEQSGLKRYQVVLDKFKPYYHRSIIRENGYPFDPNMWNIKDNSYVEGNWASDKYFKFIEDIIKLEFTVKMPPDEENAKIADLISQTESVSIHVRRGDYVSDPQTNLIHGTCSLDYYYSAIEDIAKQKDNPHFFIFSNDISWAKQNLKISYPVKYITNNGPERNYEDLRLMSLCKNHIIANSSFSWWGAWLSNNPNQRVYSPKKWYNIDYDIKDLLPYTWIKI